MILVDTSIWIDFLKNSLSDTEREFFIMQLEQQNIVTTSLVFAELLQGAKNKQEIKILEEYFSILENLEQKNTWIEAGKFSQENKLISFGVGLPDATLLVIAKNTKSTIWTRDKKLKKIMEKLHIGVFP